MKILIMGLAILCLSFSVIGITAITSQHERIDDKEKNVIYLCGFRAGQEDFGAQIQGYRPIPIADFCKEYSEKYWAINKKETP